MANKKKIDPTQPTTDVTLGDKTYTLCFNYRALAEAEAALRKQGHDVNLLAAMADLNFSTLPVIIAAGAHKHHPDVTLAEVEDHIHMGNVYEAAAAVQAAWLQSMPKVEENPTDAGEAPAEKTGDEK